MVTLRDKRYIWGGDNGDNDGTNIVVIDDNKRSDDCDELVEESSQSSWVFRFFTCSSFFRVAADLPVVAGRP